MGPELVGWWRANHPDSTPGDEGVPAVLAQIQGEVRGLADTLWAARNGGELMDTVAAIEALKSTLDGVELGVVRELEATGAVQPLGWASTQEFVTTVAGGHKGTGPATVRLAKAVDASLLAPWVRPRSTGGCPPPRPRSSNVARRRAW